jgi:hypothetical protein
VHGLCRAIWAHGNVHFSRSAGSDQTFSSPRPVSRPVPCVDINKLWTERSRGSGRPPHRAPAGPTPRTARRSSHPLIPPCCRFPWQASEKRLDQTGGRPAVTVDSRIGPS